MARIRSIKPEACNSKDFAKLSFAARYFFQQLWCFLDDDGRGEFLPKKIAGEMYPHDDDVDAKTILSWVDECVGATVLLVYEVNGDKFMCAPKFASHQKIDRRTPSKIPAPPGEIIEESRSPQCALSDDSTSTRRGLDEDSGEIIEVPGLEVGSRKKEVGSGNRNMEVGSRSSANAAADFLDFVELVLVEPPRFAKCQPPRKDSLAATISPHAKTYGFERLKAEILAWRDWHTDPANDKKGGRSNPLLSLKNWLDKAKYPSPQNTPPPMPKISAALAEECAQ